ncbi:MAG: 2-oxo acid dehydrogenase subunit E2 [Pontiellaceae bacterium]
MKRFSDFNAHWVEEKLFTFEGIHIGFAVDTPKGLMVPVIRNAHLLNLEDLSKKAKELAASCLSGEINPDDLTGATFTVTNLGSMGIESFTPVLNLPEVAIIGICSINPKPILNNDEVEFIPHMGLSLTFNHCALDGAPAARFLSAIRDDIYSVDSYLSSTIF